MTSQGELAAPKVVVTIPLGVLQAGGIVFEPALSAAKQHALERLGMGVLDKCYLRFAAPFWRDDDTDWIGRVSETPGEWAEYLNLQRALGQPILLAFHAADQARALERLDDAQTVDAALAALRTCYGGRVSAPTGHLVTRWAADPFARGSYSFIRPGGSPRDREALAAPIGATVFFAGEATETAHPATVRGAYESGLRVAAQVLG
jgi:monoamine oxidase